MAVTTPLIYDTPSSFSYDVSKIQVQDDVAQLAGTGPYDTSNPNLLSLTEIDASALSGFTEVSSIAGSDAITYTLRINGTDYYWNGAAWSSSDLSYAKTNTAAVIAAHLSHASMTSLLSAGARIFVRSFLHSATGTTTPTLTSVAVTYTFYPFAPASPPLTTVYVYLTDLLDSVIGTAFGAVLSVTNISHFKYGSWVVLPFNKSVNFNSSGYASINLMETASVGVLLNFSISYVDNTKTKRQINFIACMVPNAGAIALTSITQVQGLYARAAPAYQPPGTILGGGFPASFQEYNIADAAAANVLLINLALATYNGLYLWYDIVRGANSRLGWLRIISDGTNPNTFVTEDVDAEIGACGITWAADVQTIAGVSCLCLSYQTTTTGAAAKMNAVLYAMTTPT